MGRRTAAKSIPRSSSRGIKTNHRLVVTRFTAKGTKDKQREKRRDEKIITHKQPKSVMKKVAKQIAKKLQISLPTCSKHRTGVLDKLDVDNDVQLVRRVHAWNPPSN